jgi:hypothetical protein
MLAEKLNVGLGWLEQWEPAGTRLERSNAIERFEPFLASEILYGQPD